MSHKRPCPNRSRRSAGRRVRLRLTKPLCDHCQDVHELSSLVPTSVPRSSLLETTTTDVHTFTPEGRGNGVLFKIPTTPILILDAPLLVNDFYRSVVAWSACNQLAVALGEHVYVWTSDMKVKHLVAPEDSHASQVVCVSWMPSWGGFNSLLSVTDEAGFLHLWDTQRGERILKMDATALRGPHAQPSPVALFSVISWSPMMPATASPCTTHKAPPLLAVGFEDGSLSILQPTATGPFHLQIISHVTQAHTQRICAVSWSAAGQWLATGCNGNTVHVWSAADFKHNVHVRPKYTFRQHRAGVRALAWSPKYEHLLATGGGHADGTIRFWSMLYGTECLPHIDVHAQVCALVWSRRTDELVASTADGGRSMSMWAPLTRNLGGAPVLQQPVIRTAGDGTRSLVLLLSPDGECVVTDVSGEDGRLHFWSLFPREQSCA